MPDENGHPRWRDLDARDKRLRDDLRSEIVRCEHRLGTLESRIKADEENLETVRRREVDASERIHAAQFVRIDAVEAVIDKQRGAWALIIALIGTNVLLAVATGVALLAALA